MSVTWPDSLPRQLRVLDRDRADRGFLRAAHPAPAVPGREPAAQPRPPHGRDRASATTPAARPITPARSPPAKTDGAMRCLRRRLSDVVYRLLVADQPQRGTREGTWGRHSHPARLTIPRAGTSEKPQPGSATQTLLPPAAARNPSGPARVPTATARRRCQRGAPRRTNDVDTDKRRRTIAILPGPLLTTAVIEGSQESKFTPRAPMHKYTVGRSLVRWT